MKKINLNVLVLSVLLVACGGINTKMTGSWQNEDLLKNKTYNSVFIDVMGPSIESKSMLEDELAILAAQRGVTAYKSKDMFNAKFSTSSVPSKDELLETIKQTGAESIFTVALKDKETTTRYVPGTNYYAPMRYVHYGRYYGYYSNFYPVAYDPGYYKEDKVYFVESNLYDVATEQLIWSAQSKTYNPGSSEGFVKGYTQALIEQLIEDGVIKPED